MNESAFDFEDHFHNGKIWWTASFTCPVTKRVYQAAPLADDKVYEKFLWSKGERKVPIEVENRFYFQRLKTAIHAAAASRMDEIHAEGGKLLVGNAVEDQASEQTIETTSSASEFSSIGSTIDTEAEKLDPVISVDTSDAPSASQETNDAVDKEAIVLPQIALVNLTSPKNVLHNYYSQIGHRFDSDAIETTLYNRSGASWWTSSFDCPLSGNHYTCGTLIDEETYGEVRYLDGIPYYSRAKSSGQAAAARAIDHLMFQLAGVSEPRLCQEDPSAHDAVLDHSEIENRQLTGSMTGSKDTVGVKVFEEEVTEDDVEVEDVEFTLQPVSTASVGSNTLGRLMEAWSGNLTSAPAESQPISSGYLVPLTRTPKQEQRKILSDSKSWLKSLQSKRPKRAKYVRFHNPLQLPTLESCNTILTALAKANQMSSGSYVQDIADEVFNFLWSGPKPSVDTYNAYIQCLSGEPEDVARMAQGIFADMVAGKKVAGNQIPAPTVEVFNTVLKLWARTGDAQKCQEIMDLLKSSKLEANSDTYLALLSSLAYGTFDKDRATAWIEEMKDADLYCKEAYYAPLRWAGKKLDATVMPWDNYADVFDKIFSDSPTNNSHAEAEAVEAWVMHIDDADDLEMTVGCHEAMIQAWIRTESLEGLDRADSLSQDVYNLSMDHKVTPRLQTFLPIIAAWATRGQVPWESAEEEASFMRWKKQLRHLSKEYPQVPLDNRLSAMHDFNLRQQQESLKADAHNLQKVTQTAISLLNNRCRGFSKPAHRTTLFVEMVSFCDALMCCKSEGLQLAEAGQKSEARAKGASILKVVSIFEAAIKEIHGAVHELDQAEDPDGEREMPLSTLDLQLRHLLHASTSVYHQALCCMDEIEQACSDPEDEDSSQSLRVVHLPEIEGMLRRSEEHRRILATYGHTAAAIDLTFADGFTYRHDPPTASHLDLCSKVMELFLPPDPGSLRGDQIRIVTFILDKLFDIKNDNDDMIQLSSICLDIIAVLQSIEEPAMKNNLLQHFLKVLSGKANQSVGKLDINSIVQAAKSHLVGDVEAERPSKVRPRRVKTERRRVEKSGTNNKARSRSTSTSSRGKPRRGRNKSNRRNSA